MSDPRAARNGDRAASALRRAEHLHSPFGTDRFGRAAERFARFFGTPRFILAPLILLAQTRQADRDKAQAEGDERATAAAREHVERQTNGLRALLQANTALTERIAALTSGIHAVTCDPPTSPNAGPAAGKAPS